MEGFLRKKKGSKNYHAVVEIEDVFGNKKRKEISTGTDKEREAKKFLRQLMHELDTGTAGNLEKVKLKEHIDQFLRIRKNDLSPNTYADYENILVKHVIPIMGELYVNKIKSIQLQEYYALKLETLSACTVNKHHRVLKKLF